MSWPYKPLDESLRDCECHALRAKRWAWVSIALAVVAMILSLGGLIGLW